MIARGEYFSEVYAEFNMLQCINWQLLAINLKVTPIEIQYLSAKIEVLVACV